MTRSRVVAAAALCGLLAFPARAGEGVPPGLDGVGIVQRLDAQLPLDLAFRDETGKRVVLGDLVGGKPTILNLVYYECPMLCTLVVNGLVSSMRVMAFSAGNEFNVVTLSIDPSETPELAAAKKKAVLAEYGRPTAETGWRFLTGDDASIRSVADAVGFEYRYDAQTRLYSHASGIMVLTPEGRVSRYFFGIEYAPRDLRLALVEASRGKIGTMADAMMLFCYHYDPKQGRYSVAALNLVRLGGVLTVRVARSLHPPGPPPREPRVSRRGRLIGRSMATDFPLFPEQASTTAAQVDALFFFLLAVTVFFSVLIAGLVIFFGIRYRRRAGDRLPEAPPHALALEITWSVIPLAIAMVVFVWGASVYFHISRPPDDAMNVLVTGKRWMWKLQHLNGRREINELHVPVGRAVRLTMTSEDVIHCFYVPAFRVKADVFPGTYSTTWFEATKPGRYHLFCAEYCGTKHSEMGGWVTVLEPAEFQAWLSGAGEGEVSPASAGEKLFTTLGCATCHRKDSKGRGPVLDGLFGRSVVLAGGSKTIADENYLRESIVNPGAKLVDGVPGRSCPRFAAS